MRPDYAVFLAICAGMILVTAASMQAASPPASEISYAPQEKTAYAFSTPSGDVLKEDNLFVTQSGIVLKLSKITSEDEKNVTLPLQSEGKVINFNVTMKPGVFSYAQINGILIVPKTSIGIIPEKTSYYTEGDELIVSFNASGLRGLAIYTGRKGQPSLVFADSGLSWAYSDADRMLSISSENLSGKVYIFWEDFTKNFIEDTERIETLENRVYAIRAETLEKKREAGRTEASLSAAQKELKNVSSSVESLRLNRASLETRINEAQSASRSLEDNISANVLVAPKNVSAALIVAFISAVLLADAALFVRKVKK